MSQEKRRGAAEVFREQNVMQMQEPVAPAAQVVASAYNVAPESPLPHAPKARSLLGSFLKTSEELQLEKEPIRVRETGWLFWKRVIVPPNVYVVQTRSGRRESVTIGLGLSFRYNPATDAYLVVPAAMQTIGVVANCISQEKQGINILAYVQWQIDDFSIAYRKLDFSDSRDPLGIVNAQLREQAEAAIKDKIATMSVEEVLTDKEPIIEELTTRLKTVAEGRGGAGEGLGIKIVTVQLKEALIASQSLWENLQAPFRHEKQKTARISELTMQDEVRVKELETRQLAETRAAETQVVIERTKQSTTLEKARLDAEAEARQKALEVEQALAQITEESRLAIARLQSQLEDLERQTQLGVREADYQLLTQRHEDELQAARLNPALDRLRQEHTIKLELEERANQLRLEVLRREAEIRNLAEDADLMGRLIERLPELAAALPEIKDLHVLQTGSGSYDALVNFIAQARVIADSLGITWNNREVDTSMDSQEPS